MDKTKRHNIQLKYDNPENVVLVYTCLVVKNTAVTFFKSVFFFFYGME